MKFKADITILPHEQLLDPQGKVVTRSLHQLGLEGIENVRVGKHITLEIEAANEAAARQAVDDACVRLLVNTIVEYYRYELEPVGQEA